MCFHRSPPHRPSSGSLSSDTAGMNSVVTVSLTSVMLSFFTHMSILETLHVSSSLPSQTGNPAVSQSIRVTLQYIYDI